MLAPISHILPLTTIRRQRTLPVPGKVVVRKGQKVSATETVAEASQPAEHILLEVARGLGVTPKKADQLLQVKSGDTVAEGDILAGPVGLTRRVMRAPCNGRIVMTKDGQVLLQAQARPLLLKAALPGEVIDLIPDRGVVIETTGALIQGVWGNGQVDAGVLSVALKQPGETLSPGALDVSQRGAIVLGGYLAQAETLKAAAEVPLRGLILASMDPTLRPQATRMPFPVIVLEGFGPLPMNSVAFKLLTTSDRRDVALNAAAWDPFARTRPEVIIPLPAPGVPPFPAETEEFGSGQKVRVRSAPYLGQVGELLSLLDTEPFPSGIRAPAARVSLENGETVTLPLANLEVLA